MSELGNLIQYTRDKISRIQEEIENSNSIITSYERIKSCLISGEQINVNISELITLVNNSKIFDKSTKNIISILNEIDTIKKLISKVDTDIENLDIEKLKSTLLILDSKEIFEDLKTLKTLYEYAISPDFEDEDLKNNVFQIKAKILRNLNSMLIEDFSSLKSECEILEMRSINKIKINNRVNKEFLDKLTYYLDICLNNKKIETEDDLKEFFEFIKNSPLTKEEIFKLIVEFSKLNINYYSNLRRKNISRVKSLVSKNSEKAHEELNKLIPADKREEPKKSEDSVKESLSFLTEEEIAIYEKVKLLLNSINIDSNDEMYYELFKDDFSLNDRKEYYGLIKSIDWSIIKTDFVYILEPNLCEENKKEIFEIFKYIIDLNEKYIKLREVEEKKELAYKEERKRVNDSLNIIKGEFEDIFRTHRSDLEYLNKNDQNKNYCKLILELYQSGNKEEALSNAKKIQKDIESIKLLVMLGEMSEFYNYINNEEIGAEDLNNILEEYERLTELYDRLMNELKKDPTTETVEPYDGKNFICVMNEDIDYSDEGIKKEVQKTLKVLKGYDWVDIVSCRAKNKIWGELKFKLPSGKESDYSNELFSVGRIWATAGHRTGIVVIKNICPENKEKLKKRYNVNKIGVVAFVIGAIYVEADHSEYSQFVRFVNDNNNRSTIDYYVQLFMDENTPEEKLFEIIDKGIKDCKEISSGQFGTGGTQL